MNIGTGGNSLMDSFIQRSRYFIRDMSPLVIADDVGAGPENSAFLQGFDDFFSQIERF